MTSDAVVVDVSRDWAIACDVQQRSMQGVNPAIDALDYSARCRQVHALGGDCYDFEHLARWGQTIGFEIDKYSFLAACSSETPSPSAIRLLRQPDAG